MARDEVGGSQEHDAGVFEGGDGVPGIADAEKVQVSAAHVFGHLWRGNHAEFDVAVRIDAPGGEPGAEEIMVGGGAEDVARHEPSAAGMGADVGEEVGGGLDAGVGDVSPERDGISSAPQAHDGDERFDERIAAEEAGDGHAEERVGGVEVAEGEFIADVGPANLAVERDIEAFVGEEAALFGDEDGGGVDEGDKTNSKLSAHAVPTSEGPGPGGKPRFRCSSIALRVLLKKLIIQIEDMK